jgi:hypothetical protein
MLNLRNMAKSKYKEIYCNYCKRVAKMAILKEPEDNKGWFLCSRCHHSFYIDLGAIEIEKKAEKEVPSRESCLPYNPTMEYSVGDPIYHTEWDDIGKVESKKKLSNGSSAIMVKFLKSGMKNLIEKLPISDESVAFEKDIESDEKELLNTEQQGDESKPIEISKNTDIEKSSEILNKGIKSDSLENK